MAGQRMRQLRGMEIVARGGQVRRIADSEYLVHSQNTDLWYRVGRRNSRWRCECQDYLKSRKPCKHAHAVSFLLALPHVLVVNAQAMNLNRFERTQTAMRG